MGKFLARIGCDYGFAQEMLGESGTFWKKLEAALPLECEGVIDTIRFTFALVTLRAETKAECRRILTEAWEQTYGGRGELTNIFITRYDDDTDFEKLMYAVYRAYYGIDDYIRLVTDLRDVIELVRKNGAADAVRKQSYLLAIDGGCGCTTIVRSFGDYLKRMKVYDEEGDEERKYYIELKIGSETAGGFTDVNDAVGTVIGDAEKKSYGIIAFDISYFLDGRKYDELRSFIGRLSPYQESSIFLFRIPFLEKKALDEISNVLSDQMLLKVLQVPPLDDAVLMEEIWNYIWNKNLSLDPAVYDLIRKKLHREKMDGRSYGFKTADKIATEAVLLKASHIIAQNAAGEEPDMRSITLADLECFMDEESSKLTGFEALGELIGMETIIEKIKEIVAQVKLAIKNERLDRPCIHMRFTGSPGTGKTTVARLIGQILREEGVLRKGGFFEYEGRDLVAEYEGQTAVKTASICRDAYGSVLFIDEAYALNEGSGGHNADFGREALATLVSEMENHRDDMLVVMAGYEKDMDELMKVNQGLRSRMPYLLHFPNYTKEQLFQIFMQMVKKHFDYEPELEKQAHEFFLSLSDGYIESREFANARFSRNLYERTWSKGALRCSLSGKTDIVLTREDFVAASSEKEFSERIESKKTVGFGR